MSVVVVLIFTFTELYGYSYRSFVRFFVQYGKVALKVSYCPMLIIRNTTNGAIPKVSTMFNIFVRLSPLKKLVLHYRALKFPYEDKFKQR